MSKYSPSEIDALLDGMVPKTTTTDDLPADFFDNFEARILAQTVEAPAAIVPLKPRSRRPWLYAVAAAAVLLFVAAFAMHHSNSISTSIEGPDDIYAVTDEMTIDDIQDLDELFEADVFLEEL